MNDELSAERHSYDENPFLNRSLYEQAVRANHNTDEITFDFENALSVHFRRVQSGWRVHLEIYANGVMMYNRIPSDENVQEFWQHISSTALKIEQETQDSRVNKAISQLEEVQQ